MDYADIHPHNDDPMVMNVRCENLEIKRDVIDQERYVDIQYMDEFERL